MRKNYDSVLPTMVSLRHTRLRLDFAYAPSKTDNVIAVALFAAPMRVKSNLWVRPLA